MPAKCKACEKVMTVGNGCTYDRMIVKSGSSSYSVARITHYDPSGDGRECHDCNVEANQYHHPNCDMEVCPLCGSQLISCDCPITEYALITKKQA